MARGSCLDFIIPTIGICRETFPFFRLLMKGKLRFPPDLLHDNLVVLKGNTLGLKEFALR